MAFDDFSYDAFNRHILIDENHQTYDDKPEPSGAKT